MDVGKSPKVAYDAETTGPDKTPIKTKQEVVPAIQDEAGLLDKNSTKTEHEEPAALENGVGSTDNPMSKDTPITRAKEILVSISHGKEYCQGITEYGAGPDDAPEAQGNHYYWHTIEGVQCDDWAEPVPVEELAAGPAEFWDKIQELLEEHKDAGHGGMPDVMPDPDANILLVWPDGASDSLANDESLAGHLARLEERGWHAQIDIVYSLVHS